MNGPFQRFCGDLPKNLQEAAEQQLSRSDFRCPRAVAKHGPQICKLLIGWS